jgi:hypothetical protein
MNNINSKYVPLIITIKVFSNSLINICKKMDLRFTKVKILFNAWLTPK